MCFHWYFSGPESGQIGLKDGECLQGDDSGILNDHIPEFTSFLNTLCI